MTTPVAGAEIGGVEWAEQHDLAVADDNPLAVLAGAHGQFAAVLGHAGKDVLQGDSHS